MKNKLIYVWINKEKMSSFYGIELALYKAGYRMKILQKGNELINELQAQAGCCAIIIEFDTLVNHKKGIIQLIKERFKVPLIAYFQSYESTKIETGLLSGFDDFLILDYSVNLVQMKIMNILDSSPQITPDRTVYYQNLKVDEIGNVYCDGVFMDLSRREAAVLLLLILSDGNRVSKKVFQERIWPGFDADKSIRDIVLRLRKKMKDFKAECEIISLNSWGYMLECKNTNKLRINRQM